MDGGAVYRLLKGQGHGGPAGILEHGYGEVVFLHVICHLFEAYRVAMFLTAVHFVKSLIVFAEDTLGAGQVA